MSVAALRMGKVAMTSPTAARVAGYVRATISRVKISTTRRQTQIRRIQISQIQIRQIRLCLQMSLTGWLGLLGIKS